MSQQVAILASGSGSNAQALWRHLGEKSLAEVVFIGCNRGPERAGIYERAEADGLVVERFARKDLESGQLRKLLEARMVDWIFLAGFLMRIPRDFIAGWPRQIVNIHPSLLPHFGGQGMWGHHVHEAVWSAAEADVNFRTTGMTIHRVNENYDEGEVVFQAEVAIDPRTDDPSKIASKVLSLEHTYYPKVAEHLIRDEPIQKSISL